MKSVDEVLRVHTMMSRQEENPLLKNPSGSFQATSTLFSDIAVFTTVATYVHFLK